ncbi:MAG: LysR substrate-binding domain-containing protein [Gammaproteobacteria bacterium]|nr:LysR substrate-binding domain-containing protein [Gammaproteobacteria bacterium]
MELRQLRSLVAVAECDFSVSRAAQRLHLVQPAVSHHLKQLEEQLGTELFRRQGKRLTGLNEIGLRVLGYAREALAATTSITAIGRDHAGHEADMLRIAATHTQARYVLPPVIRRFTADFPEVSLELHQGTPAQLIDMVLRDSVDLAVCTEGLGEHSDLVAVPCYRWNRCLITPPHHPVLARKGLDLEALCAYPLITYVFGFTGRGSLSRAFAREGLRPRVVLAAADTDVIKTYVREGMGIGIIAAMAYQPEADADLAQRDLAHLFPWEVTRIAYRRDRYLGRSAQRFIDAFQAETAALQATNNGPFNTLRAHDL